MIVDYPFTEQEMQKAYDDWGANCGPSALAFALQIPIDVVRGKIPGFEEKRYTSPTMMKAALDNLGFTFTAYHGNDGKPTKRTMFSYRATSLTRIQWTGPWTAPGANPKWAYRQTHWIATWQDMEERGREGAMQTFDLVFDCNGGVRTLESWEKEIVPLLIPKRGDGGWFPTHVWRPEPHGRSLA